MTWQMKMIDSGAVPVGMATLDARNLFKDGKAAFMIDGPWVMTLVKTENPDLYPSIGYAAPPTPTHAAVTGGAFFTIPPLLFFAGLQRHLISGMTGGAVKG